MLQSERMEFQDWLRAEIERKGWNQAELARRAGLSEAAVSRIMSKSKHSQIRRQPGRGACQGIARALEVPVSVVYPAAGYLPDAEPISRRRALIEFISEQMSEQEYSDLLDYIQFRLSKKQKQRYGRGAAVGWLCTHKEPYHVRHR